MSEYDKLLAEGAALRALLKAGPYFGPRGGMWADPEHKVPYKPHHPLRRQREAVMEHLDAEKILPTYGLERRSGVEGDDLAVTMDSLMEDGLVVPHLGKHGWRLAEPLHIVTADPKGHSERWWESLRNALRAPGRDYRRDPLAHLLMHTHAVVRSSELDDVLRRLAEHEGWDDGPDHAPHPVKWRSLEDED